MAWIELHQSAYRHPKTRMAADLLGISRPSFVGYIGALWCWGLDALDASGGPLTPEDVALATEWEGDAQALCDVLVRARFLDRRGRGGRGLYLHNWARYAGKWHDKRRTEREKKRKQRDKQREVSGETNLSVPGDKGGTVPPTNQPTYQPTDHTLSTDRSVGREIGSSSPNIRLYTNKPRARERGPPTDTEGGAKPLADRPMASPEGAPPSGEAASADGQEGDAIRYADELQAYFEGRGPKPPEAAATNPRRSVSEATVGDVAALLGYPVQGKKIGAIFSGQCSWTDGAQESDWREVLARAGTANRNGKDGSVREGWVRATLRSIVDGRAAAAS